MKTLKLIQSPLVALLGFTLCVGINLPHIVHVYGLMAPVTVSDYLIYPSFFVLELGILILAINGREGASKFFTGLIFFVNLAFYWHKIDWIYGYEMIQPVSMGILLSALPAYLIYFFSHLFASFIEADNWRNEKGKARNDLETAKNSAERAANKAKVLQSQIDQNRLKYETEIIKLKQMERLGTMQETAYQLLAEKMGFTELKESSRKKYIQTRAAKLRANGISGKDRERIELEILLLEMVGEKETIIN